MSELHNYFNRNRPAIAPYSAEPLDANEAGAPWLDDIVIARSLYADTVERGDEMLMLEGLDEIPELRELALDSIREEQAEALLQLMSTYDEGVDLQSLLARERTLTEERDQIDARASIIEEQNRAKFEAIDRSGAKVAQLAPKARERAMQLIEERKQKIRDEARVGIEQEQAMITRRLQKVTSAALHAYEAWPLPNLVDAPRLAGRIAVKEASIESPLPMNRAEEEATLEDESISSQLAEILSAYQDEEVELADLVEFFKDNKELAGLDTFEQRKLLIELFRGKSGREVQETLDRKQLVPVHGWRLTQQADGRLARERILKIMRHGSVNEHTTDMVYPSKDDRIQISELWGIEIDDDYQEEGTFEGELPQEDIHEVSARAGGKEKSDKREAWTRDLKESLGRTIQRLESVGGLLGDEPTILSREKLRALSSSMPLLGTKTNSERLVAAGLLSKGALELDYQFSTAEIVLMVMYNSSRKLFKTPAQAKEAIDVTDKVMVKYFAQKRERNKRTGP